MTSKRTVFLGAGASSDAGYPLTSQLYDELKNFYSKSSISAERNEWNKFKNYRNRSKGRIGSILRSENLELVLTLPDLLNSALEEFDFTSKKNAQEKGGIEGARHWSSRVISEERQVLEESKSIRDLFLKLVEGYFNYLSYDDSRKEVPIYYRNMLEECDFVITTNWDSLTERILLNQQEWYPFNGYGVALSDQDIISTSSKKIIYKLHGSVGWRKEKESGNLFLSSTFKRYLLNRSTFKWDQRELPGNNEFIFITPSYLKQLSNEYLIQIWQKAHKAICESSEIVIVGYSLPKADVAIRALLLAALDKKIKVIDPDPNNKANWDSFIGENQYEFIEKKAGQYFQNSG